jgi:hypothetical protein
MSFKITPEFIWETIVPIAKRYDAMYINLMPYGFWYDRLPFDWGQRLKLKEDAGEYACLSSLGIPPKILTAYTSPIQYSKTKWKYADQQWTWDWFKAELFSPERCNVTWDSMLLSYTEGMGFSKYDPNDPVLGKILSPFDRGEQIGILLSEDSRYKGWSNCNMWYE